MLPRTTAIWQRDSQPNASGKPGAVQEGVGKSFANDATFSASGTVTGTGREGIVEFIKVSREHMSLTVHTPDYVQLSFDGSDSAKGLIGAHLELVLGGDFVYGAVR